MMWQKVIDFGKQLFSVTQKLQKHEEDIKDVRQDIKALRLDFVHLRQEMSDLTHVVERLTFELLKDRETSERDREIQRLRLENILLRFERGLPPGLQPRAKRIDG
jgi:predicted  nucleic acid-binding Zn-ribbon protein